MFLFMFLFIFLFMTFYQCFFIMFLNKHIEKTFIIYYMLSHSISWRTHWGNLYHLLCAFSFYFSIFFENTHEFNPLLLRKPLSFTMCFLIGLSFSTSALSLGKPLLFTMCFLNERIVIEKPSIILYVLSHRVLRRAHYHWGNLYYLVSAFSVIDVRDLTLTLIVIDVKSFLETLRKPLLFNRCFLIIFLDERIEKTSII